ncbi:uncharacterized protein BDR25DRAFT_235639, partial [Lindgomyces ingoldianus]
VPQDPDFVLHYIFGNDFVCYNSWKGLRSVRTWFYGVSAPGGGSARDTSIQPDLCGFLF